jgi:mannose-6-phosphate isomerase-like protein (cupin superfamily)
MITVDKVWGREEWLENNAAYCVKLLRLNRAHRCSLHYHPVKDETFYVVSGRVLLEYGILEERLQTRVLAAGDHHRLPRDTVHRFTGLVDSAFVEAGTTHSDDDVVRLTASEAVPADEWERVRWL